MKLPGAIFLAWMASASSSTSAQSCAAPIVISRIASVTGDTCTAQNELGTLCIFAQSPANDIIYSLTIAPPFVAISAYLTNNTPTWNPAMVLMPSPCNGNTPCTRNADANGPGGNETLNLTNLAEGTYFLVVTSTVSDTTCGQYKLTIDGTPVELLSFDVS